MQKKTLDTNTTFIESTDTTLQESVDILNHLSEYSGLITKSFYFVILGMILVYFLHKITSRFLYPYVKNRRVIKVIFGTLYALIIVVSILMVIKRMGFDVTVIGKISILGVLITAVGIFFLLPFLPRLPFKIGNLVEVNGVVGIVDNISTYHTTIKKFDGTMVFIPNTSIIGSVIMNYHDTPNRQIEISINISSNNINLAKEVFLDIMYSNSQVLKDPSPSIVFLDATAHSIKLIAYCWVENANWATTKSDLWLEVQNKFTNNQDIHITNTEQDFYIMLEKTGE